MNKLTRAKTSNIQCLLILFGVFILAFGGTVANAEPLSYQVKYAKESKLKAPLLKNIELLIQLHKHGNSIGRVSVKTDKNGRFFIENTMGKHLVVHILSIKKENQTIRCRGISSINDNLILINCYPK
ncbi:MAG: hypothetical protein CMF38_04555 [Legionellaceae bacterium]|nr:hypothetical protein [Legionellaceae bacterium]|tara:strand:+ start:195 stop:575 length:381 start_codon:yes stop_codon:yes gene_type:complete